MDFGKLAYLNTEDLNKRLQNLEKNSKITASSWSISKTLNAEITENFGFDVRFDSANEPITVIGKLKFFHTKPKLADITLKLNGMVCYFDTVQFSEGEKEYLFLFCIHGQKNNRLEVLIQKEQYLGKLIAYDLIITGGNVRGFSPDVNISLINRQSNNIVGCKIGNDICCYQSEDNNFDLSAEPVVLGEGQDFCLCQGLDDISLTAFVKVSDDKILKFRTLHCYELKIDSEVSSCAVMPTKIGYLIVYIKNTKAFYRIVYPTYQVSQAFEINSLTGVFETVRAVFDAPDPMFLLKTADEKIYLKTAKPVLIKEKLSNINISCMPDNA